MPISPPDVHAVASKLWLGQELTRTEESCVRTVAGRAYYAAYLSTREAVRSAYRDPTYDVQHGALWSFMIGSGQTYLKLAGNMLKELVEARERADYDLTITLRHADAEPFVDNSQEIVSLRPQLEAEFRSLNRRVTRR